MNSVKNLIQKFESLGIHLYADGEKLRYKAAKELMTPEILSELKAHKSELLAVLQKKDETVTLTIDRANRFEPFPLTDVQSAYLMGRGNLFEYGGVSCHVYLELKYQNLEAQKVKAIWNKLVQKYGMLHAVIDEGGFQQVLKDFPELDVPEWNLVQNPECAADYETFRKNFGDSAFPIGKVPMFGLAVSRHKDFCILHLSIEFLIADWTSIWELVAEFEAAYFDGKEISGEETVSFRDYLVAEKKLKATAQYEKEKKYWLARIPNLPDAPELPTLPVTNLKDTFGRKSLRLNKETWELLKATSKKLGLTPTIPILIAYSDVLAKWSRNKNFCINMTVLNRLPLHENVMDIIGDFTSLDLLEMDNSPSKNFVKRARAVNARLFEDLDNRLFSGVEVMRTFAKSRKKSGLSMPIVYTSAIGLADSGTPLRGEFIGGISQTPQTFIDCQVMDGDFGLQVNWDFREGVFPEGVLEAMFEAFERRLKTLAEENFSWEKMPAISLPESCTAEQNAANATQKSWNVRMLQSDFLESVQRTPEKIAIDDGKVKFTFAELHNRSKVLAQKLINCGVKPQDLVPVLMEKSAWQIVSVFGILFAGAVYVPIAAAKAKGRAEKIIQKSGAKVAVGISSDEKILEPELTTIAVDTLGADGAVIDQAQFPKRTPDDIAYIIYTSGSTGEPKGVVISHKGAMNTIDDMNQRFGVGEKDSAFGLSQLNFDLSVYDIFGVLGAGGTLIFPTAEDYMNPEAWEILVCEKNITVWNSVPALMRILLDFVEKSPRKLSLKNVFLSGDWIPLDMPDRIQKISDARVVCLGGATEASIWSNFHVYNPANNLNILPYGKPLANQTMHILDANGEFCPTMVTGQIALGGDGVALGYYNDDERTAKQFVTLHTGERVYLTGDLGRYLPGGEIEFLGREDTQVKIRGHRIELGEIENVLKECPGIAEAVAIVSEDKREIYAAIVPVKASPENILTTKEKFSVRQETNNLQVIDGNVLKAHMDKYLLHYMHPNVLMTLDALPLSANGKIDRKKILQLFEENKIDEKSKKSDSVQMDANSIEGKISKIVAKALNVESIELEDNFYDFGADSLLMAQIVTSIRNDLAQDKAFDALLKQMLDFPTVRETAEFLEKRTDEEKETSAEFVTAQLHGKPKDGRIRVLLPAIFWNAEKFKELLPRLVAQDEGEVMTFNLTNDEIYCAIDSRELGSTLSREFSDAIIASGAKKVQLIAYCFISTVGIEIAERLLEKGIEVEDVVLVDGTRLDMTSETTFPRDIFFSILIGTDLNQWGIDPESFVIEYLQYIQDFNKKKLTDEDIIVISKRTNCTEKIQEYLRLTTTQKLEICKRHSNFGKTAELSIFERLFKIFDEGFHLESEFHPAPYYGDVRYLKADNDQGLSRYFRIFSEDWTNCCIGNLTYTRIPGTHESCLANPEHATELAKALSLSHKETV